MRRISRWGLRALGLTMAGSGVVAMLCGWDTIQLERGWSLFIGGAAILAGGAIVLALGQVVARLDELLGDRPHADVASQTIVQAATSAAAEPAPIPSGEPLEIDSYRAGDVTYVMYSDGAVEVRRPTGEAERYASLAELRERAAARV